MRKGLRKQFIDRIGWCHICGLPIPEDILDSRHPLFGTIDHVIPRSAGGSNSTENRAPAHQVCNRMKSGRPVSDIVRKNCRGNVRHMLQEAGVAIPVEEVLVARTGMQPTAPFSRMHPNSPYFYRTRWEDDGGYSQ